MEFPSTAVAKFDFHPSNPDEIALVKGARLRVTAREGEDWLRGFAEGAPETVGIFPANHVEVIPGERSEGARANNGKRKPPPRRSRRI